MSYITLYRKYRSQSFKDLVGQESIIKTLSNAIENDRLTHAYIFSGPRGTGKTSTARILAKSLNCRTGKSVNPCNVCNVCKGITDGSSMDVIEIDAASNRGIDEMRQVREKVNFAPVEGKYKVYIIDEVHMLTEPAFNALLKTLEEPPTHTIFILATTDPQKVPVTILSRCQRLDFGRIPISQISEHLKYIAAKENATIEEKAALMIAKNSEGGLRDAISLMDQVIAFSGNTITSDSVITIIGNYSSDFLFDIAEIMAKNGINELLSQLDEVINQGKNITQIVRDLIDFYRSMMFVKLGNTKTIEMSEDQITRLKNITANYPVKRIKEIIMVLSKAELDMKWHPNSRLLVEIAFIDLTMLAENTEVEKEAALPKHDYGSNSPATKAANPARQGSAESGTPVSEPKKEEKAFTSHISSEPSTINTLTFNQVSSKDSSKNISAIEPVIEKKMEEIKASIKQIDNLHVELSLPAVKHHWTDIINKIKGKNKIKLSVYLLECEPFKIENQKVFLAFKEKYSFHKDQVSQKENADLIEEVFKSIFGNNTTVEFVTRPSDAQQNRLGDQAKENNEDTNNLVSLFDGQLL
ncbi:MAG TPA: DNA polymerase III subunit gamma/tau [Candidatus Margulisbacteria bacterium]|nr:MAG: hypothetical protein A2X43_10325 [Candidatus Margulisbacteria bacterium GWD2_39_127]OGI05425.1 MAG: hypothetical protein A2X42_09185 [Candidatus Margulisbacteria bacterium GWF2_38_17]OGI07837.1 MAG: hypothetical protein A2X41_11970 [Candidatus Margulisbacteria bacterium GWE2_39_32]HAR62629.1 hypothetical protein [Candidatus Margulisiibacteriota bacterium]HCT84355.1 DNA polymerase III subunit gamma/tau [Candidatus Margulisiibacteriota bacterium]